MHAPARSEFSLGVLEFVSSLPVSLQLQLSAYAEQARLDRSKMGSADLALALLRINSAASLEAFASLTGRTVTHCPPALPPWPPKPVPNRERSEPIVLRKSKEAPRGEYMERHFRSIRVGMSRQDMLSRGATARDIRYWMTHGYIEMGAKP